MRAHTCVSPIHMHALWPAPGLWGEPSSQTVGHPVWEHWLSLLLTGFEVVGVKQEGASFRPQGPPTEWQAVLELVCGPVKLGEGGGSQPEVLRWQLLAPGLRRGPTGLLGAPRGLYFLSLPGTRSVVSLQG